jgi:predicted transcriptional regulator
MGGEDGRRDLFDLLSDERTMQILTETDGDSRSVEQLADACEASGPTLYRHVNALLDHDLLQQETEIDARGNHYTVYRSNVQSVDIRLDPSEEAVHIDLTYRDSVDQFKHLWEEMKHDS